MLGEVLGSYELHCCRRIEDHCRLQLRDRLWPNYEPVSGTIRCLIFLRMRSGLLKFGLNWPEKNRKPVTRRRWHLWIFVGHCSHSPWSLDLEHYAELSLAGENLSQKTSSVYPPLQTELCQRRISLGQQEWQ